MRKSLPVLALTSVLTLSLGGCFGETVIDTRSAAALNETVAEISEDLSPAERKRFKAAIKTLVDANRSGEGGEARNLDQIAAALGPHIGGKTAMQAIAAADAWTAAEEKRLAELERRHRLKELEGNISEYTAEIARLETVIVEQAAQAEIVRGKIGLSGERYFWKETLAEDYPLIDVEVTNNHDRPIRTVVIRARLRGKDGPDPLVDGQLRYEFRSSLKPGKSVRMRFEPDVFGDWAKTDLKDREDLELNAEIVNLSYPDGTELIRTFVFRGDDPIVKVDGLKRRLEKAQAERSELLEKTQSS